MANVLVINAHSTLNRGDAAILEGLIASVRIGGSHRVTVATKRICGEDARCRALGADETVPMLLDPLAAPTWMQRTYPTLALWVLWAATRLVITRNGPTPDDAVRAYRDADVVISSGGGYLGGRRMGSNFLTVFPIWFARHMSKPLMVAPVTVEPMNRATAFLITVALRGNRGSIFARESATVRRLAQRGIAANVAPDLAFRAPSLGRFDGLTRFHNKTLVIGWAPRRFGSDHDAYPYRARIEEESARAIHALVRDYGARVVLVPESNVPGLEDDGREIGRIADRLPKDVRRAVEILEPALTIQEAAEQFGRVDALLAFRMHAALIALFARTPSVVLGYEAKVADVFEAIGLRDWVMEPGAVPAGEALAACLVNQTTDANRARIEPVIAGIGDHYNDFDKSLQRLLAGNRNPQVQQP